MKVLGKMVKVCPSWSEHHLHHKKIRKMYNIFSCSNLMGELLDTGQYKIIVKAADF